MKIERFLSADNVHLMCMKVSLSCSEDAQIQVQSQLDNDIWDINGPHLKNFSTDSNAGISTITGFTQELGVKLCTSEVINSKVCDKEINCKDNCISSKIILCVKGNEEYSFTKFASVFSSQDGEKHPESLAMDACRKAVEEGYDELLLRHCRVWTEKWKRADVLIEGDEEAQFALRYSIYHLLAIAPTHSDKVSIPARGLSGQVYKGAIFWDTEMFMLPFFNLTDEAAARNLVMYRFHTLDGARRKAREYGYRGAFYAWESQETGDDACTLFNVTDVFTNRPMRTYFRDKQIHISADAVYGIWKYYISTGDVSILTDGGAEVILECARFFYSYAYFKPDKNRYEILDVTGPDEYHERVNNNTFTNMMVKNTLEITLETIKLLSKNRREFLDELISKLQYEEDINNIKEMLSNLYIPEPDKDTLIIEQFDGYNRLEDLSITELKERVLNPNEYFGGRSGIATTTQILKQADTVLMLNLFKDKYSTMVKKANWEFYEPRTEHGSSLSSCVYAMLAADVGNPEWGYKYFMKTATIDLTGKSKQYVGNLYIGGTHPAANGGAWMATIHGFAGLCINEEGISINPHLPEKWKCISFSFNFKGIRFEIIVTRNQVRIKSDEVKNLYYKVKINGKEVKLQDNKEIEVTYEN